MQRYRASAKQAAWALGAIGEAKRAVSALTKSLKDTDAGVRRQAAWALGARRLTLKNP